MGVGISYAKKEFLGEGRARACQTTLCRELYKNGLTARDAVWVEDTGGPKEACVAWGHMSVSWRIRLNRPAAAVMSPYVKLL